MHIRPLTDEDFASLYVAFLEAFSDYVLKMVPSREQFAEMLIRRGFVAQVSAGAFQDERLVAFALNAIDGDVAYDTGTGVVPAVRRQALGKAVMQLSYSLLKARQCNRYVLEVLETNVAARSLYESEGFLETRGLQCWAFESKTHPHVDNSSAPDDWQTRPSWWNVNPSWQNSTASIHRARDLFVVIGDDSGYAIVFPSNGELAQLAVDPTHRRKGIGTRLLNAAAAIAQKPLRIMNVDDRDKGISAFLEAAGARRTLRQIEMERKL